MADKVKDISKKGIVEAYQAQIRESIDRILGLEEKLSTLKKEYIKGLEENINRAPYELGYMELVVNKSKK